MDVFEPEVSVIFMPVALQLLVLQLKMLYLQHQEKSIRNEHEIGVKTTTACLLGIGRTKDLLTAHIDG